MRIFKIPVQEGGCSLNYCFINGSQTEPKGSKGILHLIEHLHFRDTVSDRVFNFKKNIEGCGAQFNAFTSESCVNFHVTFLPDDFQTVLSGLQDIVFHKEFNTIDLEGEKKVVYREFVDYNDDPSSKAFLNLFELLFDDRYTNTIGLESDILNSNLESVTSLYDNIFGDSNLLVLLTGPPEFLNKVNSNSLVSEAFTLRKIPLDLKVNNWSPQRASYKDLPLNNQTCYLRSGFALSNLNVSHEELQLRRLVLDLASEMLGGSWLSPLLKIVREEKGLCYSTSSSFMRGTLNDVFFIAVDLDPTSKKSVIPLINTILESFYKDKDHFDFCLGKTIKNLRWSNISGLSKVYEIIEKYTSGFTTPTEDFLRKELTYDRFLTVLNKGDFFNPQKFSVSIVS